MLRIYAILLIFILMFSLCACGSSVSELETEKEVESTIPGDSIIEDPIIEEKPEESIPENDYTEIVGWDLLEESGKVETEDGIIFVYVTMPSLIDDEVAYQTMNKCIGDTYTSIQKNEDNSTTYKMTKDQFKLVIDNLNNLIETDIKNMVESDEYAFTEITHNEYYTEINAILNTDDIGPQEYMSLLNFLYYNYFFKLFYGKGIEDSHVCFYNSNGGLIYDSKNN